MSNDDYADRGSQRQSLHCGYEGDIFYLLTRIYYNWCPKV